jgi:cardiolipin synthase A/B
MRAAGRCSPARMLLIVVLGTIVGCSTLPDPARAIAEPQQQAIEFEGRHGPVTTRHADAIMARLGAGSGSATDAILHKHLAYEQAINADSPLILGNHLTLLQNGPDTYAAMLEAIRGAVDHINLETYIFSDGEIGQQFVDALLLRQAAGVRINVIHDSVGAIMTPTSFYDRMREGGISVLEYNPVNPLRGNNAEWLLNNRDHRKQLLVDGRIAFIGGINISESYSSAPGSGRHRKGSGGATGADDGWRDTHMRIEGPVVAEFQKLFIDTWERQLGSAPQPASYFPVIPLAGTEIVRAIGSTPRDPQNLIYLTLISAIAHAEQRVYLTIAYFAPDPQLLAALAGAARRGVDVRLVLPSRSDSAPIFHLGRSYYAQLLRAGVRIHERRGAVMHAKTACIDGVWSTIGSTNLDWRSFLHNDEINAVVIGREFGSQMETMFAGDLRESDEILRSQWRLRSPWLRVRERLSRIGAYWL